MRGKSIFKLNILLLQTATIYKPLNCFAGFLQYENISLNPFIPNVPFLYPLKTLVFWCFQGVEKGYIENEWDKSMTYYTNVSIVSYGQGANSRSFEVKNSQISLL